MTRLIVLDKHIHGDMKIDTSKALVDVAETNMVPVVVTEFLRAAAEYPILVTKNDVTGEFVCIALLGFESGENLYWEKGAWEARYIPLNIARQPFFIGTDESREDEQHFTICFDADNRSVQSEEGDALFGQDGEHSAYFEGIRGKLSELIQGEADTRKFLQKIQDLELLKPVRLEVSITSGDPLTIDGLYTIDEQHFRQISNDALIDLHQLDYVGVIYSMLISLGQINSLIVKRQG